MTDANQADLNSTETILDVGGTGKGAPQMTGIGDSGGDPLCPQMAVSTHWTGTVGEYAGDHVQDRGCM